MLHKFTWILCQFISWTNWLNSGKFMDNCWILCQVMADMKKVYGNLIIIDLYFVLRFPSTLYNNGTPRLSLAQSFWNWISFQCSWNFNKHLPKFNEMKRIKWKKISLDWKRIEIQILVHKVFGLILFNTPPALKCTLSTI